MGQVTTCLHRWIDVTALGDVHMELRCAWCGQQESCRRDKMHVRKHRGRWVVMCPCCRWWGVCKTFDDSQMIARQHARTRHAW